MCISFLKGVSQVLASAVQSLIDLVVMVVIPDGYG